ncbi:hypothetical protein K438DRAFT_1942756 [Mycena galopus ATCC 62051]|nr:hypothetical protein K438DRAFT_1942756 [Mycena galopus ATCC 62051]
MPDAQHQSSTDSMKQFLKEGLHRGKDELLKGKLKFEHSLGLGPQPNVIPPAVPGIAGAPRTILLGWHPVAGFAGKWFADKSGLGRLLTEKLHKCPDPTQHWAILVGEFVHELWMDENLNIIYLNERIKPDEWHTFEVGSTRFNDEALRRAGQMTIYNMRAKQKAYNLITNNCQNFALQMLDVVQMGKHLEFATAYSVYHAAVGSHSSGTSSPSASATKTGHSLSSVLGLSGAETRLSTLFTTQAQADGTLPSPSVQTAEERASGESASFRAPSAEEEAAEKPPHHVIAHAQEVMDEQTTTLDDHAKLFG